MAQAVFVMDKQKHWLMLCSEKLDRLLLASGLGVVVRIYPFTFRLNDRVSGDTQSLRAKLAPSSKVSDVSLACEQYVLWLGRSLTKGLRSRRRWRSAAHFASAAAVKSCGIDNRDLISA